MTVSHGYRWGWVLFLAIAGGAALAADPDSDAQRMWKVGVAKVVITPDEPMPMSGYAGRIQWPERKLHDLWAKALVLEDADGRRAVLITLDLLGISRDVSVPICEQLDRQHGLRRSQVALCCSHTHTGPVVGMNLPGAVDGELGPESRQRIHKYSDQLIEKVVRVVGQALGNVRPATLCYATGKADFAVNRRNNAEAKVSDLRAAGQLKGPVDHEVPVLVARDVQDEVIAIVAGYACHATVLSDVVWSGDWPGFAQLELEKLHPQAVSLFCAGCGGDQNPLPRRSVPLAEGYGKQLAAAIDAVVKDKSRPVEPALVTAYDEIDLPFAEVPSREQFVREAQGKDFAATRAKLVLQRAGKGPIEKSYPHYPVQVWQLGKTLDWVFLGGEAVVDYSLRLKAADKQRLVWISAYTNDVMAYIPSRRVLAEGGYEGRDSMIGYALPSVWAPEIEDRIAAAVMRLRAGLSKKKANAVAHTPDDAKRYRQQVLDDMQLVMGELPDRSQWKTPTVEVLEEQANPKFTRQTLRIAIDGHDSVPAYFYLPKDLAEGEQRPTILALHQTNPVGKKEVDGQDSPDQGYARELAERGFIVLAPDYPSFGDYPCSFSDKRFVSGSMKGIYNHMRCIDWLVSRGDVAADKIGVIGHSLGGHNSIFLAAFDPRVKAIVSSCGWTPFHDYYQGHLTGWTGPRYMPRIRDVYELDPDRVPFDFDRIIASFAPRAFLSISPLHDDNFDVNGVRKAMTYAAEAYRLQSAQDNLQVRHPDCQHSFPESERAAAYEFLEKHLR